MFPETELNSRKYGAARICQAAESDGDRQITKPNHREGEPSSITHFGTDYSRRGSLLLATCSDCRGRLGYDHNPNRHAIDSRGGTAPQHGAPNEPRTRGCRERRPLRKSRPFPALFQLRSRSERIRCSLVTYLIFDAVRISTALRRFRAGRPWAVIETMRVPGQLARDRWVCNTTVTTHLIKHESRPKFSTQFNLGTSLTQYLCLTDSESVLQAMRPSQNVAATAHGE
jgi:hypothetical protein